MTDTKRSHNLDFLKIISAVIIFFHHYQQVFDVRFDWGINFFKGYFFFGFLVELFFIISGFLMYKYIFQILHDDIHFDVWFGHRLKRLIPLLAICAFTYSMVDFLHRSLLGVSLLFDNSFSIFRTVVAALGMQAGGAFKQIPINNPAWYISVLLICYVMFYVLTSLAKKIGCKPYYLYIVMILVGISISEYELSLPFFSLTTARGYYSFFFGLILAQYINTYGIGKFELFISSFVLFLSVLLLAIKPQWEHMNLAFCCTFFIFPAIIIISETTFIKKALNFPVLKVLSDVSFNLYLWHMSLFTIISLVVNQLGLCALLNRAGYMCLTLFICTLWAFFSHYFIENKLDKVFSKLLNSIKEGKRPTF